MHPRGSKSSSTSKSGGHDRSRDKKEKKDSGNRGSEPSGSGKDHKKLPLPLLQNSTKSSASIGETRDIDAPHHDKGEYSKQQISSIDYMRKHVVNEGEREDKGKGVDRQSYPTASSSRPGSTGSFSNAASMERRPRTEQQKQVEGSESNPYGAGYATHFQGAQYHIEAAKEFQKEQDDKRTVVIWAGDIKEDRWQFSGTYPTSGSSSSAVGSFSAAINVFEDRLDPPPKMSKNKDRNASKVEEEAKQQAELDKANRLSSKHASKEEKSTKDKAGTKKTKPKRSGGGGGSKKPRREFKEETGEGSGSRR
ncbi:hypothetical protein ONS95_000099 [Cadophora gregata]|uniref:uncharacterized protein n=1 Tax=Cadophora gregata TaxID=51156 RepID=UPI0026DB597E|nr:uncharacterized protein ONS95_000099 [Cadophora gregata]KAK0128115.1 hypothetical protein ONS95_000099 [Cadophora gregata]